MRPEDVIFHAQADDVIQFVPDTGERSLGENMGRVQGLDLVALETLWPLTVKDEGADPCVGFLY